MALWNKREWNVPQIRQWLEDGRTHQWIADQLGCAAQSIGKVAKLHGLPTMRRGPRPGPGHPNWRGGRHTDVDGYVYVWVEGHPHTRARPGKARPNGYVLEHRLVMEQHLGRYLLPAEVVHHLNGNPADNRLENLQVFASNADHLRHELTGRVPNWSPDGHARILAGAARGRAILAQQSPRLSTDPTPPTSAPSPPIHDDPP
jgi:hypothetical protein